MFIGFPSHQLFQKVKEKFPNFYIMLPIGSKQYRRMFFFSTFLFFIAIFSKIDHHFRSFTRFKKENTIDSKGMLNFKRRKNVKRQLDLVAPRLK
jgi:hypothetical protein